MAEYTFYALITATGFVAAGLVASLFQLVTGQPIRFGFTPRSVPVDAAEILARMTAGPAIIMRNAVKAAVKEGREPYWLALSTLLSVLWSFFTGVVILELIYSFSASL
ncbi:MAG: hypothetical protein MI824_03975 [Hyphomicrobiales bacterium]|nr:hypothetical protein [Hyphomicrobiales bacterium]